MDGRPAGIAMGARKLADLVGDIDDRSGYYRALAERIRLLIVDGRLPVGTRLPSERDFAATVQRSRSTVVAAYNVLREGGYVRSRQGSGSVAALPSTASGSRPIDFAHAVPPPIPGLADYLRGALTDVDDIVNAPAFDMLGDVRLREQIARRYTSQGVFTRAEQIMVTVGGQHAIGVVARSLLKSGDRVLMDSPCYPHAYDAFHAAGGRIVTTPVTQRGWDIDHAIAMLERFRPTATFMMPDFQNPTGASMSGEDRSAFTAAAARVGSTLIVDETTADLDIDRGWSEKPFAYLAREHGADVLTIGSLSKSIWGGLRVGWVRTSSRRIEELARQRPTFDLGTPRLEQLVAVEVIADLPRLLVLRANQSRASRDHLVAHLREALPDWEVPRPAGGLSVWVGLDKPVARSLAILAHTRELSITAGPRFTLDGSHERFLRLPFTSSAGEMSRGVGVLRDLWSTLGATDHDPSSFLNSMV